MPVDAAILQDNSGFAAAGNTTYSVTLSAATAGNCLVFIGAGDKDISTWTPGGSLSTVFFLHGGDTNQDDVSLVVAFGVAAGGETSVGGTVGVNSAGAHLWAAELEQDGSGTWTVVASASNHADGATPDPPVWSTGTTGAATANGLALAGVACDSVNTAGTASWSNSYVVEFSSGNGSTQAGLWVSSKSITSGNTTTTTLTRTGGSPDQHSGAVVVIGRVSSGTSASAGNAPVTMSAQNATVETTNPNPDAGSASIAFTANSPVINYTSAPTIGSAPVGFSAQDASVAIKVSADVAEFEFANTNVVPRVPILCANFETTVTVDQHFCSIDVDYYSASLTLDAHEGIVGVEAHYGEVVVCGRE